MGTDETQITGGVGVLPSRKNPMVDGS